MFSQIGMPGLSKALQLTRNLGDGQCLGPLLKYIFRCKRWVGNNFGRSILSEQRYTKNGATTAAKLWAALVVWALASLGLPSHLFSALFQYETRAASETASAPSGRSARTAAA